MIKYKLGVLLCLIWVSFSVESFGREYEVISPDKNLQLKINIEQKILYSVGYKSKQLIKPSPISLTLSGNRILGANPEVVEVNRRSVDEQIVPPVRIKSKVIVDKFNETSIVFKDGGGAVDILEDSGLVVSNPIELKNMLIRLKDDISLRKKIAKEVKKRALQLDIRYTGQHLNKIYKEVLNN